MLFTFFLCLILFIVIPDLGYPSRRSQQTPSAEEVDNLKEKIRLLREIAGATNKEIEGVWGGIEDLWREIEEVKGRAEGEERRREGDRERDVEEKVCLLEGLRAVWEVFGGGSGVEGLGSRDVEGGVEERKAEVERHEEVTDGSWNESEAGEDIRGKGKEVEIHKSGEREEDAKIQNLTDIKGKGKAPERDIGVENKGSGEEEAIGSGDEEMEIELEKRGKERMGGKYGMYAGVGEEEEGLWEGFSGVFCDEDGVAIGDVMGKVKEKEKGEEKVAGWLWGAPGGTEGLAELE